MVGVMTRTILRPAAAAATALQLVVVLAPMHAQAQTVAPDPRIDAIFAEWDRPGSPGCALSVLDDGRAVYTRGYGSANLDYDTPITSRTVFYLASVSKQFTAAAVALAAEQGHLSLDDDARSWFPELPDYGATIRVRHLVHHTSGLRDYLALMSLAGMPYGNVWTDGEILDLIARQRGLNFAPGEEYLYSNSGYFLLSELVRRATGKSLREYTTRELFEPLGMRTTWFHDDAGQIVKDRAVAYAPDGDGFRISHLFNFDKVGSGGLYSTVEDLARWDANAYGSRIGGPAFLETLHTRGVLSSGDTLSYAFGLQLGEYRGLPTVEHGGTMMGFRTVQLRFPEERTSVVVLCNLGTIDPSELARAVADVVLADRLGPTPVLAEQDDAPTAGEAAPAGRPAAEPVAYAGRYFSDELGVEYEIEAEGDRLLLVRPRTVPAELVPSGEDTFRLESAGWTVQFLRSGSSVIALVLDAGRVRDLRFDRRPDHNHGNQGLGLF
jgi:CubicO group peptidase (beta-lactamase class C family)